MRLSLSQFLEFVFLSLWFSVVSDPNFIKTLFSQYHVHSPSSLTKQMRILVLSDTHGHLDLINTLVEKHKADAVVHCGDFGVESAERLLQTPQYADHKI